MNLDPPSQLELATAPRTPKLLLSPQEAADALSVSLTTFKRLLDRGEIQPVYLTSKTPRYDPRDLVAWIDQRKDYKDTTTNTPAC